MVRKKAMSFCGTEEGQQFTRILGKSCISEDNVIPLYERGSIDQHDPS